MALPWGSIRAPAVSPQFFFFINLTEELIERLFFRSSTGFDPAALRLYPPLSFVIKEPNKDPILPFGGGADGASRIFVKRGQTVIF